MKYAVVLSLSHASFSLGAEDRLSYHEPSPSPSPSISDGELRALLLDTVWLNCAPIWRLTKALRDLLIQEAAWLSTVKVEQSGY